MRAFKSLGGTFRDFLTTLDGVHDAIKGQETNLDGYQVIRWCFFAAEWAIRTLYKLIINQTTMRRVLVGGFSSPPRSWRIYLPVIRLIKDCDATPESQVTGRWFRFALECRKLPNVLSCFLDIVFTVFARMITREKKTTSFRETRTPRWKKYPRLVKKLLAQKSPSIINLRKYFIFTCCILADTKREAVGISRAFAPVLFFSFSGSFSPHCTNKIRGSFVNGAMD